MESVSVSELRAQLSRYLRRVRMGGEVLILHRGKPVARLVGTGETGAERGQVDRLVADGTLRPGNGRMLEVAEAAPINLNIDLMAALSHQLDDRF